MNIKKSFRKIIIMTVAATLLAGAGCTKAPSPELVAAMKPVNLNWWGVFDDEETVHSIISAYNAIHPNVNITFTMYRSSEYENALLNALAEDRGPDIFSIHNTWVNSYSPKLAPIPASFNLPYTTSSGGSISQKTVTVMKTTPAMTINQFKNTFVDVAAADCIVNVPDETTGSVNADRILAMPLAADNLALYYNKDLFNAVGIAEPPADWTAFQKDVAKLTKLDAQGNIVQSGVGMGTASNVERYADILSLLMLQNGTQMTDENDNPTFDKTPASAAGRPNPPSDDAVIFYTDFANPSTEVYSWNDKKPDNLAAFVSGESAMFLGYAFNLSDIRSRAPKLNFGIAKLPQLNTASPTNYANYWVQGVSKKSKYQNWAWDFLNFAASPAQNAKYLDATRKPTALRSGINKQLDDLDLSVFADQMLTAKSWYHGKNEAGYEKAFGDLINNVLNGAKIHEAVSNAVNAVYETMR
jgi:ABC-type glycerol-3-phosphate transport system substrate-binding protein